MHILLQSPSHFVEAHDPISWCLANAHDPILSRAKAGLVTLSLADHDRIFRLVTRRCAIHFIEIEPSRITVQYWVKLGDLRPFFKEHGIARKDMAVTIWERKHEFFIITNGTEFLYGDPLGKTFPVEVYQAKWDRREVEDQDDGQRAPCSWSSFSWDGKNAGAIPWAALKSVWRKEQAPICPNDDKSLVTIGFGNRRTFFNRYPLFIRICLGCGRRFDDGSFWEVDEWVRDHLDNHVMPGFHKERNGLVPWQPPQ